MPCANSYFIRWLQCSTLTAWCTPTEVYSRCTYEPKGTWFRGFIGYPVLGQINAPNSWAYCMPELERIYDACPAAIKQADSCNIWSIAKDLGITLSQPAGYGRAATAALPTWNARTSG